MMMGWFWVDFVLGWFWVGFGMGFLIGFELILSCFLCWFWVIFGFRWWWWIVLSRGFELFLLSCCDRWEREGISVIWLWEHFSLHSFPPDLGGWDLWPGRENFLPGFPSSVFFTLYQTVENTVFHPLFFPMFSILSKINPTKHSVRNEQHDLHPALHDLRPDAFHA